MNIVIVSGSSRKENFTSKVLAIAIGELRRRKVSFEYIDSARIKLSFPGQAETKDSKHLNKGVKDCEGLILATPEYNGSFSSMMKLIIENLGYPSMLEGKPIALIGIAAGQTGAVKALEHMRSMCAHNGAIVVPTTVSVSTVQEKFDDDKCTDPKLEKRICELVNSLLKLTSAINSR